MTSQWGSYNYIFTKNFIEQQNSSQWGSYNYIFTKKIIEQQNFPSDPNESTLFEPNQHKWGPQPAELGKPLVGPLPTKNPGFLKNVVVYLFLYSLFIFVYFFVYFFYLFIDLCVCLSACLLVCLLACLFGWLFVCLCVCVFACLLVCLFVCLFSLNFVSQDLWAIVRLFSFASLKIHWCLLVFILVWYSIPCGRCRVATCRCSYAVKRVQLVVLQQEMQFPLKQFSLEDVAV